MVKMFFLLYSILMFEDFEIIDISLALNNKTIIYPNNPQIKIEKVENAGSSSVVSKIEMGSHSATHIDAPLHVIPDGLSIDELSLSKFIGKCRVLDFTHCIEKISKEDLLLKEIKSNERILFKTKNSIKGFEKFYDDFIYLAPDGAKYLASLPVTLVGIDSLSIKQRGSKDSSAHTEFLGKNIPIIEGLDLSMVQEGEYILSAFPLKITGIDAAPSRVVLLKKK